MIHGKQLVHGLSALSLLLGIHSQAAIAAETTAPFRIMSEQEIKAHSAAMDSLQGQAREDYRNAQYEHLKQRARAAGYSLPDNPPWAASSASAAADPAPTAGSDAEALARHNELRAKLQARQQGMQVAPATEVTPVAPAVSADAAVPASPAEAPAQAGDAPAALSAAAQAAGQPTATAGDAAAATAEPGRPAAPPMAGPAAMPAPLATPVAPQPPTPPQPAGLADGTGLTRALNKDSSVTTGAPLEQPREAAAPETGSGAVPRDTMASGFAPIEPPAPPALPEPPARPEPPAKPEMSLAGSAEGARAAATGAATAASSQDAMNEYRENMRARFDAYMQERQAKHEQTLQRQREQHEAAMEQQRARQNQRGPYQPFGFPPPPPAYGPRYPAAFPGYRTPYWQQQR